ncbi:hypothetical protein KSC_019160 [Ktedonobacter sp. SOSP1-52]|uniref:hypothetical protein n=1 Tax=Ktedonobacter sp. SOSP1-52 TaxID=2778366 RepID=UPI00191597B4|nr:hypothetical protein [Ktedonobacter sp. SOSP1-52]GHO63024.1 hypothetical protein KSC_019160 [Ktedonobacter sp. SOSP1-52]
MTPKHQEIIDMTLQAIQARERQYHRALSILPEEPFRTQSIEHLRASLLGQKLRWIAEYVEGYPAAVQPERREQEWGWRTVEIVGGIRGEVFQVCSVVYDSPDRKTWFFPKGCQRSGVGGLLHAALLQFYREHLPPDQLVSVSVAAKEIGIGRQTLHEWMTTESVCWIYESERDVIWLDSREVRRLWRKKHGLQNAEPDIEGPCCPPRE